MWPENKLPCLQWEWVPLCTYVHVYVYCTVLTLSPALIATICSVLLTSSWSYSCYGELLGKSLSLVYSCTKWNGYSFFLFSLLSRSALLPLSPSLPLSDLCLCHSQDVSALVKCVSNDLNQGKTPLLVIAYAGKDQCYMCVQFYPWVDYKYAQLI